MTKYQASSRPPLGHSNDESVLVEQARVDPNAFAALYDRYVQPVYRYIASRLGDLQIVQALVEQTFQTARVELPQLLPGDSFAVFLFSIGRSQLSGYLRSGGYMTPAAPVQVAGQPGEQLAHLRALILGLSEGEQELLRLRYAAGLGFSDLASLARVTPEAVNTQLDRILNRLLSQAAVGVLDYPRDVRRFENQVRAAVRNAEAAPAFVTWLRNQLLGLAAPTGVVETGPGTGQAAPVSRLSALPEPTWLLLLLALALFLLLTTALAIGPRQLWIESLALVGVVSQTSAAEQAPAQAFTLPTATPTAPPTSEPAPTQEPSGIQFTVEQVTELEDGYLLEGSLSWQGTEFHTLGFDPFLLELTDAAGRPVPFEQAEPDTSGYDPAGQRMPWAVRAEGKGHPGPLTLSLPVLEGFKQVDGVAFDLSLGATPRPGQEWPVDLALEAGGWPVQVLSAVLSQAADGAYWLAISAQVDPQQVTGLLLRDQGSPSAQSGGQGGSDGKGFLTESLRYDSLPQGVRQIEIIGLWTLVSERLTVPVKIPGQ